MPSRHTALYRLFDATGRLLYVGITDKPELRWKQHARDKAWWPEVTDLRLEWCESRGVAETREREAVCNEAPVHNKTLRTPLPAPGRYTADDAPEAFRDLAHLLEGPETLDQAAEISRLFEALPEFQRRLRARRKHIVRTLHDRDGVSYTDMAPKLGVKPERVSGIARGHSRSPRKRN